MVRCFLYCNYKNSAQLKVLSTIYTKIRILRSQVIVRCFLYFKIAFRSSIIVQMICLPLDVNC